MAAAGFLSASEVAKADRLMEPAGVVVVAALVAVLVKVQVARHAARHPFAAPFPEVVKYLVHPCPVQSEYPWPTHQACRHSISYLASRALPTVQVALSLG